MKLLSNTLIILLSLILFNPNTASADSKGNDVPIVVTTTFADMFPKAKKVKWEKEDVGGNVEYVVVFLFGGEQFEVTFSEEGNWLETKFKIAADTLPDAVKSAVAINYKGYTIADNEAYEIQKAGSTTLYEVVLVSTDGELEVIFDSEANLVEGDVY